MRVSYLSEELLDEPFSPAVMKVPRLRRMTDVGAVDDQRQRLRLVNAAHAAADIKALKTTHASPSLTKSRKHRFARTSVPRN